MTDVSHLCWSGLTQISGALRSFLAATQQEGYIFSPQVKPDRLQLLPITRAVSLSSKNTATTKTQIRSGSIACNRQYAANRCFCCCCRSATLVLGLWPLAFLRRLVPPRHQQIPLAIPPAQPLLSLILITAEP